MKSGLFLISLLVLPFGLIADEDSIASWEKNDFLLYEGAIFNNLLRYNEAIQTLSLLIIRDPSSPGALIERAYAYFELVPNHKSFLKNV